MRDRPTVPVGRRSELEAGLEADRAERPRRTRGQRRNIQSAPFDRGTLIRQTKHLPTRNRAAWKTLEAAGVALADDAEGLDLFRGQRVIVVTNIPRPLLLPSGDDHDPEP